MRSPLRLLYDRRLHRRLTGEFPPDYRLVLSRAQIEAYLEVLDALTHGYRFDPTPLQGSTYVRNPDEIRELMHSHRSSLELKNEELQHLQWAFRQRIQVPWPIRLVCSETANADTKGEVALSEEELNVLTGLYPTHTGAGPVDWHPSTRMQHEQWQIHLDSEFSEYKRGRVAVNLCAEKLRMEAGRPTLCRSCGKTVIPGRPEYREEMERTYGTRWKESAAPIRARLCEGCMRREASARGLDRPMKHRIENENKARRNRREYELVGDWYDFQDENEKLDLARRLSED